MSIVIKRRRGSTAEHANFVGATGELTVDTTKKTVVVHDGITPGGFPLAREDLAKNHTEQLANLPNYRKVLGNPARFYPVPASSLAVKALLTAIQGGSGDPSPDNIRAISPAVASGGTVKAKRTGKNLLERKASFPQTSYGITATLNADGSITLTGTATQQASIFISNNNLGLTLEPGTYTGLPSNLSQVAMYLVPGYKFGTFTLTEKTTFATAYLVIASGTTLNTTFYPQLEPGNVATPYEPYAGNEYTLTAQQAKYGLPGAEAWMANDGSEGDPTAFISLTGNETVTNAALNAGVTGVYRANIPLSVAAPAITANDYSVTISSHFKVESPNRTYTGNVGIYTDLTYLRICISLATIGAVDGDSDATKIAKIKAWLAAQVTAGTPVQVIYKRATPATATVSGSPAAIPALPAIDKYAERQNVVTLDKGAAEIGYAEHPNRDFARLTEKTGYGVVSGLSIASQAAADLSVKADPGIVYLPNGDRHNLLGAARLGNKVLPATNMVTNGNFNDITGWTATGVTRTASWNKLTVTADVSNGQHYSDTSLASLLVGTYAGHKYYIAATISDLLVGKAAIALYNKKADASYEQVIVLATGNQRVSAVLSTTEQHAAPSMIYRLMLYNAASSFTFTGAGESAGFSKAIAIDLTVMFGAGNEPTAAQMDAILAGFQNGWFDGTQTVTGIMPDPTNPRIDIVYVSAAGVITYLAGTAAATPAAPALPAGGVLLAEIAVAAGATSITAANIKARKKGLWVEDWITPTLLNGYTSMAGYPVGYYKDAAGIVRYRGRLAPVSGYPAAFNIPAGYRIAEASKAFACAQGADNAIRVMVFSSNLQPYQPATGYIDLSSISYKAEA